MIGKTGILLLEIRRKWGQDMKKIIILLCVIFMLLLSVSGCNVGEESAEIEEGYLQHETIVYEQVIEQAEVEPVDFSILYERIKQTVLELNKNSNLYIDLLTLADDTESIPFYSSPDIEAIRRGFYDPPIPNEFYITADDDTRISGGAVLPFPWASDDLCLIQIFWRTKGEHHVFGIDVGDSLERAEETLHELGYVRDDSMPQSDWNIERFGRRITYTKEHVNISFFVNESSLEIILISIAVRDPFIPTVSTHEMY